MGEGKGRQDSRRWQVPQDTFPHGEAKHPCIIVAPQVPEQKAWAYHCDQDKTISFQRTRNMIDAIRVAGGQPIYWKYAGVGHTFVHDLAYDDPQLIEWIFRQPRHFKQNTTQLRRIL